MTGWTLEQWAMLGAWVAFALVARVWSVQVRRRMDREHRELTRAMLGRAAAPLGPTFYNGLIARARMKLARAWESGDLEAVEARVGEMRTLAPRAGAAAQRELEVYRLAALPEPQRAAARRALAVIAVTGKELPPLDVETSTPRTPAGGAR